LQMNFRMMMSAALAVMLVVSLPATGYAAMGVAQRPVKVGDLDVSGAFARATLPNAPVGGGYLTIVNRGQTADRLISATSPAAADISLHEMKMNGDVMQMRDLPNGIDIAAGATVTLTPNGLHMMFEHLHGGFVQGKTVPVTLAFEKAGPVTINLQVLGIAASAPMSGMSM
jgi:copper(I)-binding protein